MIDVYKSIGKKIAECRSVENCSQDKLAKMLGGYTNSYISYIESGKRKISIKHLLMIALIFDKDVSFFTNDIDISDRLSSEAIIFRDRIRSVLSE